tara:strand:- start:107 stop:406 length:300 start_codon:yes stop_codon:yes gene_type:complete
MAKGPTYYQRGSTDVWDFIREQELNFHLGNAIKYICRAGYKDSKIQDLEKAIHYLENELEHEENLYLRSGEGIPIQIQHQKQDLEREPFVSEESDRRGI